MQNRVFLVKLIKKKIFKCLDLYIRVAFHFSQFVFFSLFKKKKSKNCYFSETFFMLSTFLSIFLKDYNNVPIPSFQQLFVVMIVEHV